MPRKALFTLLLSQFEFCSHCKYFGNLSECKWTLEGERDEERQKRLKKVADELKLFRCHTIMNCTNACPKGLNPAKAIGSIKKMLVTEKSA